ncbi:MAG: lysophospholipid acyltransferase family protein [Acidobacteriota bacterium]
MLTELGDWLARVHRLIPARDLAILLNPPRLVARFSKFVLHRATGSAAHATADDVRERDPELVETLLELARWFGTHYFRLRIEGVENLPASGPVLLVGNHNGGFLPSDGFFTSLAILDRFGPSRAMYALAHDFLFEDPVLRRYALRLGMLRAGHASAHHAFEAGGCVLVYPGSDLDTFRTFRDRGKIVLGGRTGFLSLALREQVPIVPVVSAGTHEQFIVLARGDKLSRLLHAHRWTRAEVLPIVLSIPWGITSGFFPYLPLPAQTTLSFLTPLRWPELGPEAAGDPLALARCYHDVETAMQAELDRLSVGRRPWLGQKVTPPRAAPTPDRESPAAPDRAARDATATRRSSSP